LLACQHRQPTQTDQWQLDGGGKNARRVEDRLQHQSEQPSGQQPDTWSEAPPGYDGQQSQGGQIQRNLKHINGGQPAAQGTNHSQDIGVERAGKEWLGPAQLSGGDPASPVPVCVAIHQWAARQRVVAQVFVHHQAAQRGGDDHDARQAQPVPPRRRRRGC